MEDQICVFDLCHLGQDNPCESCYFTFIGSLLCAHCLTSSWPSSVPAAAAINSAVQVPTSFTVDSTSIQCVLFSVPACVQEACPTLIHL